MSNYNGYSSWEHWNVANEIRNDSLIYRTACDGLRHTPDTEAAAVYLVDHIEKAETEDGAPYTLAAVTEALKGLL